MKDIKNPVNVKNTFFFNIFQKLINSVKTYVNDTEEDTFGKWFTTEYNEDSGSLTIVPKINTDDSLNIGGNDIYINFNSGYKSIYIGHDDGIIIESNNVSINLLDNIGINVNYTFINVNDGNIQLYTSDNDNHLELMTESTDIKITFNNNEYTIQESHINTLVNAAEYSYDEDAEEYILNLFPNAESDYTNFYRKIYIHDNYCFSLSDEGLKTNIIDNNGTYDIIIGNGTFVTQCNDNNINYITVEATNNGILYVTRKNSTNEQNSDRIFYFKDETNNQIVTFTVAELIAIKNLISNP